MGRKPLIEADDLSEYLPHGCTCSPEGTACDRCRSQRERIARLYRREEEATNENV